MPINVRCQNTRRTNTFSQLDDTMYAVVTGVPRNGFGKKKALEFKDLGQNPCLGLNFLNMVEKPESHWLSHASNTHEL